MISKIIARGAEAIIEKKGNTIIKRRIPKGYRYPQLDEKIRKLRTRSEAKIIEKISNLVPVARVREVNEKEKTITLDYLSGKKVADILDKHPRAQTIMAQIGKSIAQIHDAGIIHGDLTTSNMVLVKSTPYIIDFGLGFHSTRIEDKAVDIHVLKEALEARHPTKSKKLYASCMKGYNVSKTASLVQKQLEKVEKRGRYKAQY